MRIGAIGGNPTPEEVAAITAAITLLSEERQHAEAEEPGLRMWVHASRRAAQRAGMQRGPWRMSGRLSRRSRT